MTTVQSEKNPKKLVVMYAPPGLTGHLVPAVELSKLLVAQGLDVTIVVGVEAGADQGAVARIAAANPSLSLHCLPAATVPSDVPAESFQAKVLELVRASNPDLRDFLRSSAASPAALLIDHFCSSALIDVGAELGIPTYFFFSSCISTLAFSLYLPVIHEQQQSSSVSFRDMGGDLVHAPGLPPIPADHLVTTLLDRDTFSYKLYLDLSRQLCNSQGQGVIVNSCRSLEPRAAQAIVAGLCTRTLPGSGRATPPLYCVGPLVHQPEPAEEEEDHECLAWLDGQPKASVAFLCFGSMGRLGVKQMKQIAAGLEASGQRFLWAVPAAEDDDDEEDLLEQLLDGLAQRTKHRGLVLRSWAPQRQVLAHGAVGGFVTHCGWNSVLESISAGVPMLAWPLYAEQRMNKVYLVEEMRLAAAMEGYDKGMVEAEEVAAKVAWLIQSGSDGASTELRQRTQAAKLLAEQALSDHGDSKAALLDLATLFRSPTHH